MRSFTLLTVLVLMSTVVHAENWAQWRGPFFNGSTDEKNLPESWSTTENIAWTTDLPGPGAGTPIIWDDHVFISAADPEANAVKALCLDRKTGKIRWEHKVSTGIKRTYRSNFASPSPTTDGKRVIFFYGNGELVCYDMAGKKIWDRNIQKDYGEFAFLWTFASSPLLYGGKLYLQVLQRDTPVDGRGFSNRKNDSYILAMDPKTGKTLWRHIRPSKARWESLESFTTPIPYEQKGKKSILVIGGDALTAHNVETGAEQWRWETWNPEKIRHWRHVPSPVVGKDIVLVCAPKKDPIYAIKAGGSGDLGNSAVAWVSRDKREISSDVPTPAYYDGDFFVLSDLRKSLARVEPTTGKVKWSIKTPDSPKYEGSPLAADGKIYLINFQGLVVVVDAKDGDILKTIPMNATPEYPVRSSISASQGQLFVRTNRKLYCVGK